MPRSSRYYKKRKPKPRRIQRNTISKGIYSGFPKNQRMLLRYTGCDALTSTLGVWDFMMIRANGCHDPDASNIGHQPLGWDQLKEYYNHYVVNSSTITATILADTSPGPPVVAGVYLGDDTAIPYTPNTWEHLSEADRGSQKLIAYDAVSPVTCSATFSQNKFFNVKDVRDNLTRLGSIVTADPADQAIFYVYIQSMDVSSTSAKFLVRIEIEYDVSFSEPKDLASS